MIKYATVTDVTQNTYNVRFLGEEQASVTVYKKLGNYEPVVGHTVAFLVDEKGKYLCLGATQQYGIVGDMPEPDVTKAYVDTQDAELSREINVLSANKLDTMIEKPNQSLNQDLAFGTYHFQNATDGFPEGYTQDNDFVVCVYPSGKLNLNYQRRVLYDIRSDKIFSYRKFATSTSWNQLATTTKTDILTNTLVNGWTAKYGDVVLNVTGNQAVITGTLGCGTLTDGTTIMTVPSKYKPTTRSSHCTIGTFKGDEQGTFTIYVDGTIKYRGGSITGTTDIAFCFTYILY